MIIKLCFAKSFDKAYARHPQKIKDKFKERKNLFIESPFHPLLENHPLHGKYEGYRSINVTGDYRALFRMIAPDVAYSVYIDTHPKLYR